MSSVSALVLGSALALGLAAPAAAQFGGGIVHDPVTMAAEVAKMEAQIQQALSLVQAAKANLATLPSGVGLSNIQGRISAVTGILQQARSACQSAMSGKTLPAACNVEWNTATAEAAQFGAELASIQNLQNLARGTTGALQAQQASAQASLELATQLMEFRQAQTAAALQRRIDGQKVIDLTHGTPAVNPFGAP